jgi:two-component system phosphate regulon sensor histidine kinase PhoR
VKRGAATIVGHRLRLLVAILLVALPIAAGVWVFAGYASRSPEEQSGTQLAGLLRSALNEYTDALHAAGSRAADTAASRDVQRALARGNRTTLARVAQASPGVRFEPRRSAAVGSIPRPAVLRSVDVLLGRRRVGRVVVGVTLDHRLLARLEQAVQLPAGDHLVFERGKAGSRGVVAIGGVDYRRVGATLIRGRDGTSLLAVEPASRVDAAAARIRRRILLAGLVPLACLVLLVYAFAPAIAGGRTLRQQRDQAARVLSHLGEGVFLVDDAGVIRLWNPSAEAITGLPAGTVRDRPAAEVIPGWVAAEEDIPVADERPRAATLPMQLESGMLWLSISGVRFSEGTVYAFRDLTEERKLEQMRSDFVATVSHELRTPLASIHGAVLTLSKREGELDPALRLRLLSIVLEQSERLSGLVEQILLAAQLDSGGLQVAHERFDGARLARNLIEASQPRVPDGLALELAAPPFETSVVGDAAKTRHVLSNLIDNAIKYSPDGGRIDVIVAPEADRLRFTVRDQGLGIPGNEQERIFEKFYRLDATMSRGVGGSGLGLYICRELVRRMNGSIWVSSEPGAGSSFSFELPLGDASLGVVKA